MKYQEREGATDGLPHARSDIKKLTYICLCITQYKSVTDEVKMALPFLSVCAFFPNCALGVVFRELPGKILEKKIKYLFPTSKKINK